MERRWSQDPLTSDSLPFNHRQISSPRHFMTTESQWCCFKCPASALQKPKFFPPSKIGSNVLTSKFLGLWNWFFYPSIWQNRTSHSNYEILPLPSPKTASHYTQDCISFDLSILFFFFYCLLLFESCVLYMSSLLCAL